ncbi:hypothetical protein SUBVAR_04208 [Subdoligranulum variabile DSM 15176]|uniref:Uncharacterized protein n=1 Tax=Subdoligranulum variabile DSM 15176 TaxID=411471 RepID=D1PIP3_9FIRM|nr:hypothetical protein SUBVAR_04208 [Subdoligranulum variabile DSM 15176]
MLTVRLTTTPFSTRNYTMILPRMQVLFCASGGQIPGVDFFTRSYTGRYRKIPCDTVKNACQLQSAVLQFLSNEFSGKYNEKTEMM